VAPIRFVYFDLDDTLLDHQHAEREALADLRNRYLEVFGTLSVDELQERYHAINRPLWRRYAEGQIDKQTVKQSRFEDLVADLNAGHANARLIGRYYLQRYAEHWQFVDGARETYRSVAERRPVGILTNGFAEVQAEKLDRFPLLSDRAEQIVVSEEIGVLKPDPAIFAHATRQAGVEADEILYVGDSRGSDVEGGRRAGWRTAWFARNAPAADDLDDDVIVFDNWSDFRTRLESALI